MPLQSGLSGLTTGRCVKGLYNLVADVRASLYSKAIGWPYDRVAPTGAKRLDRLLRLA